MEEVIVKKFFNVLSGFKWGTIIILLFCGLFFLFHYLDKIYILKASICGIFAKGKSWAKKSQISAKVRGTILGAVRKEVYRADIIPTDLQVKWVDAENPESFVSGDQVIIRVKQSSNPHENLVVAVSEYVNEGLLHNVRRYLDGDVMEASKMVFIRKVIQSSDATSLTYLDENYLKPKLDSDENICELFNTLTKIDNSGMFVNILLNEFQKAGMNIYNQIEDPQLVAESREFMRHLYAIAMKVSNDPEKLCFNREYFKVAIIMSASDRVLKTKGIEPYLKAIREKLDEGIETIYVAALGRKRDIAEAVANEINDYRINDIIEHSYKYVSENGRRIMGVFYECSIYKESDD